ncbi:MAG TPA: 50S ribosomal protein L32, partial [Gammaproteobacteria bacterium]|nr:50S ribosomal protein L32 [Gammaproteobacteria bacterium]
ELHLRHNISPDGYYKGNKVIDVKSDQEVEEDSE